MLRLFAMFLVALLAGGCDGRGGSDRPPATLSDCGTAADPGSPDGGAVAGLKWPSGKRPLGTPAQAYFCLGSFTGSTVSLMQSGTPVTVQPNQVTVPKDGGVIPVTVTATTSGTTTLLLRIADPTGRPQLQRVVAQVVADNDRWHFKKAS
ncbi:hypothetical protein [Jatrophihabitans sp.]|uniref:hypothetical protein n=1 Tax=Jatrophihabitans sp. TaxID=1932789 RepID=UPI002C2EA399|nr:hypothetical protein [Jatrophihabitans sp.]